MARKRKDVEEVDHRHQFLKSLGESSFRKLVIIPMLSKLGFRDIIEYHGGSPEKGKDIICWHFDATENRRYIAVVAKKGDIHGCVGKSGNASEVLFQVQQALNEPYRDIYDLAEIRIKECFVIASGKIKNTAIESISGNLKATNLDRLLSFFDCKRVIELITRLMPEYWLGSDLPLLMLHDIRSSISAIAGNANLLLHYANKLTNDPKRLKEIAERIFSFTDIAQRIAEQHAFLRKTNIEIQNNITDVNRVIIELIGKFSHILKARNDRKILFKPKEQIMRAWMDKRAFEQAFWAVLNNADKYGHAGSPIEICTIYKAPHVIIRVRNHGPGIVPDCEEVIFQPYYTGSPSGPGLGLFIARKLISLMDGEIRVTKLSNPTEFSIYLRSRA